MLFKLSKCINNQTNLNDLAILGLGLNYDVVDKHIKNKKDEFNVAVFDILKEWFKTIESPEEKYQILYKALGKKGVNMQDYRKALEQED